MFFLFEIDRKYAGFGIDWYEHVKGIRLGYIAIHLIQIPFQEFMQMTKEGKTNF